MPEQAMPVPGSVCWNELNTKDAGQAKEFYTKMFGWTTSELDMGDFKYTVLEQHGKGFGGVFSMPSPRCDNVPPHWLVYFAVDDMDAAIAKLTTLGGKVHMPKTELPVGTFAIVADPGGAVFALWKAKAM